MLKWRKKNKQDIILDKIKNIKIARIKQDGCNIDFINKCCTLRKQDYGRGLYVFYNNDNQLFLYNTPYDQIECSYTNLCDFIGVEYDYDFGDDYKEYIRIHLKYLGVIRNKLNK